jgi:hypothetical protein
VDVVRREDVEKRVRMALRHIHEFVRKARELVTRISVNDLIEEGGLNPYMVAALNITSIEDVAELFVYRRVERSLGTSFGNVIEAFLRDLLGGKSGKEDPRCKSKREPWICWWDVVLEKEVEEYGKKYKGVVLSIKSGPADINKDIVERFIQHAQEAEEKGYKPYLALTYGKQAFTVAESTLKSWGLDPKKHLLVGREIFEKFLGDPNYYDLVIDMIRAEAGTAMKIFDLIDRKIEELVKELKERYGDDVGKLLRNLS